MGEIGRGRKPEGGAGTRAGGLRTSVPAGTLPLLPTACIAVCLAAGSMYWRDAPPRRPADHVAAVTPLPPSADLFRAVPEEGGVRVRAPYPIEFEQQFPLLASAFRPPEPAAVPVLPADEEHPLPRRPAPRRVQAAPALADLRPPARPDGLKPAPRREAAARIEPAKSEPARSEPARSEPARSEPAKIGPAETGSTTGEDAAGLVTLRLPGFEPVRRTVAEAVTAAGDGLSTAGSAVLGLIDRRR
ncbi:hypothetical protein [Methylobacterium oryzihabitans]|uniref:Uncharacterized protein n=1 Tax=Methylobacterium oryzihabitans TaxID=2499852 RepID=A0A3S2VPM4_9HYPH|nr:hypothetical protein [Methylobacterium oryzihabitans]RVU17759.1 hypothetical protein EOE48_12820 [Methylobacterium oryzihabitans]